MLLACSAMTSAWSQSLPMLHTRGTEWQTPQGKAISLKGVNLGNWLMLEFWMMNQSTKAIDDQCTLEATLDKRFGYAERQRLLQLHRDNWIGTRDWDQIAQFGFNVVRVPFIWSLLEDEQKPYTLRTDAWRYLDAAIHEAEARGIYVILDLHGAVGNQGWEHHSGCAGKNQYWSTPEFQKRTTWLWQQIAARYKDRSSVAGYSILNEPWGAPDAEMARVMKQLYRDIRAVDKIHVIIFPGHTGSIDGYGDPAKEGISNYAFEMHFYPGHFGWEEPGTAVHKKWLQCLPEGKGLCEWRDRLKKLNAAFLVGEFQPWADMDVELGGQITRLTYDAYASQGWASTAWSYKLISGNGGHGAGNWGMVTNATGENVPKLDFATAPLQDIEALFKRFGSVPYTPHPGIQRWLKSPQPPTPLETPPH